MGLRLGPSNLYTIFGVSIPVLYTSFFPHTLFLQLSPVLHITLTISALLSPPTAPLVSLFQDSVSVSSMLVFTAHTTRLLGGVDNIAKLATTTHPSTCPIGTPPLCCLLPCTKPVLTPRIVFLILLPVKLLSGVIIVNFLINMFLVYSGFYPSRDFGDIANIHNLLIIPFFISCMYTYKVFIAVTSPMLPGTNHTLRGVLIFIMFVFCKSSL